MQILRLAALTLPAILLASCASSGPSVSGDWESIGTISNGNIKVTKTASRKTAFWLLSAIKKSSLK